MQESLAPGQRLVNLGVYAINAMGHLASGEAYACALPFLRQWLDELRIGIMPMAMPNVS
jgi:hypothetical protein